MDIVFHKCLLWRYHYPEYDGSQLRAKVPPEGLI